MSPARAEHTRPRPLTCTTVLSAPCTSQAQGRPATTLAPSPISMSLAAGTMLAMARMARGTVKMAAMMVRLRGQERGWGRRHDRNAVACSAVCLWLCGDCCCDIATWVMGQCGAQQGQSKLPPCAGLDSGMCMHAGRQGPQHRQQLQAAHLLHTRASFCSSASPLLSWPSRHRLAS